LSLSSREDLRGIPHSALALAFLTFKEFKSLVVYFSFFPLSRPFFSPLLPFGIPPLSSPARTLPFLPWLSLPLVPSLSCLTRVANFSSSFRTVVLLRRSIYFAGFWGVVRGRVVSSFLLFCFFLFLLLLPPPTPTPATSRKVHFLSFPLQTIARRFHLQG